MVWIEETPPCLHCGFCCEQGPCPYGQASEHGSCSYLTKADELGRRYCGIYEQIVIQKNAWISPAFGAGCCSSLCNSRRDEMIRRYLERET